jgi:hypothetical protein
MAYDNKGKGGLWKNRFHEDGKAGPRFSGNVVADRDIKAGEEIPLAVFDNQSSNERAPVFRLGIDRWKEQNKRPAAEAKPVAKDDPFSDSLDTPF